MNRLTLSCLICFAALTAASDFNRAEKNVLTELLEKIEEERNNGMASQFDHETGTHVDERTMLKLKQSCDTKGSFSGMEYALMGYNVLYGYPLAKGRDPGFGLPIFLAKFEPKEYTADCKYMIPNGFQFYQNVACETSFTSKEVRSQQDFESSLGVSANIEGGGWGVSFSASASYQTAVQEMTNSHAIFILSSASCKYFSLRFEQYSPPPFEPNFLAAVQDLATSDDEQKYYAFFRNYGTHYVTDMTFGARLTHQHKMTQEGYRRAQQSSVSVSVQASYEGLFSVGGGVSVDSSTKSAVESFKQNVETTTITVGAQPSTGGINEWASTVKNTPMPMKYKLGSIEDIFTSTLFKTGDIDYNKVKSNIQRYKNSYCQSLVRMGDVTSCEALPPPPPSNTPKSYEITFYVSRIEDGITGENLSIQLTGSSGNTCSGGVTLSSSGASTHQLSCTNLGTVTQLYLSKSGTDGVFINMIILTEKTSKISRLFDVGYWIDNASPYSNYITLPVTRIFA